MPPFVSTVRALQSLPFIAAFAGVASLVVACGSNSSPAANPDPDTGAEDTGADVPAPDTWIKGGTRGNPELGSVQAVAVHPSGRAIAIGDGVKDRLVVIELPAADPAERAANAFTSIAGVQAKLGAALGGGATAILGMAADPATGRVYFAARKGSTTALLWMDGKGTVTAFNLDDVSYASLAYPAIGSPGSTVTHLTWAGKRIAGSAVKTTFSRSSLILAGPAPFEAAGTPAVSTIRTYHRSHGAFETEAPVATLHGIETGGSTYLATSFQCAPVSRFNVDDLVAGGKDVAGATPFDFGGGKQVLAAVPYEKGGEAFVLYSVVAATDTGNITGATRVKTSLFVQNDKVDTKAPVLYDFGMAGAPFNSAATRIPELDNIDKMTGLSATQAIILRKGSLETIDLP